MNSIRRRLVMILVVCASIPVVRSAAPPSETVPLIIDNGASAFTREGFNKNLEERFAHPPRQARPLVWWHWVSGNISKEGIRADLEDMKRAGIGGVQMFDVDLYLPRGPVDYGTDVWHEHVQYAMKVAEELGLEFMSMNCAGWSQSAGPWITPEKSMKKVVWSEVAVRGGEPCRVGLPQPAANLGFYRDIAVLAVPADAADGAARPTVTCDGAGVDGAALGDGKAKTEASLPASAKPVAITLTYPESTRRSYLRIGLPGTSARLTVRGQIQCSEDGQMFRTIRNFNELANPRVKAVEIAFAPNSARAFRIMLRGDAAASGQPLRLTELSLSGIYRVEDLPSRIGLEKPPTKGLGAGWDRADALAIPPDKVVDLTAKLGAEGQLSWDPPAGAWTILRLGYTATGSKNHPAAPSGLGLEVDKFDAGAVAFHFERGLGWMLREAGPRTGPTFSGILFDSWEAGTQNWTVKFPELFRQRRGYDIGPLLACLAGRVVGSRGQTEAFLADFRKTLGELYASEHYGTIARLAHGHGLKVYAEAYGGCLDEAAAAEAVDVPMAEFWIHMQSLSCRRATSLAHTTGKNVIAAESFTARPPDGRWRETPAVLKPIGDAALIEGINRMCLHTYAQQPRSDVAPGFSSGRYGTHFGRLNSWWVYAPAWIEYLSRCQALLQYGRSVKDLLYLRQEGLDPASLEGYPPAPAGYGVDYIAVGQLLESVAERGGVRLSCGAVYRALVLPEAWAASLATLRRIDALASAGVPVFGPPPACPGGLTDLREHGAEWKALVAKLWAGGNAGKVRPAEELEPVLRAAWPGPDFDFSGDRPGLDVRFAHRAADGVDLYFLSNQAEGPAVIQAGFRVGDRRPELWDAAAGTIAPAASYRLAGGRVTLPLRLEKSGSVFVVFREPLPRNWVVAIDKPDSTPLPNTINGRALADEAGDYVIHGADGGERKLAVAGLPAPIEVAGPWRLAFQPGRGAPESAVLDRLASLSENASAGIRYFSGITTYTASFTLPRAPAGQGLECVLELGDVAGVAAAAVNGQSCGIQWAPPFAARVTPLLGEGRNVLAIAVANTWVNRLIGDERLAADAEYELKGSIFTKGKLLRFPEWWDDPAALKERRRITFPTWRHYTPEDSLAASGLIGPVRIRFARALDAQTSGR